MWLPLSKGHCISNASRFVSSQFRETCDSLFFKGGGTRDDSREEGTGMDSLSSFMNLDLNLLPKSYVLRGGGEHGVAIGDFEASDLLNDQDFQLQHIMMGS